jgi:hypothetical protein
MARPVAGTRNVKAWLISARFYGRAPRCEAAAVHADASPEGVVA